MSTSRGWRLGALVAGLLFVLPSVARAEDEPGGDLKAKIRQQMERVRELMQKNEAALLELSTGKDASPRDVDVEVPPPDASSGGSLVATRHPARVPARAAALQARRPPRRPCARSRSCSEAAVRAPARATA